MTFRTAAWTTLCLASIVPGDCRAGDPPRGMVEAVTPDITLRGRMAASDTDRFWLLERNGTLSDHAFEDLTGFQVVSTQFAPLSSMSLRSELQKELGGTFATAVRGPYVVAANTPEHARDGAAIFDGIYREFRSYFSVRGFTLPEPEFPMVAVIYPDAASFGKQARKDGVTAAPGLRGYYHIRSNRVALLAASASKTASTTEPHSWPFRLPRAAMPADRSPLSPIGADTAVCALDSSAESTIVHEATHQVAYNLGLHSRIGSPPRWLVEGLAMVFETPGQRDRRNGGRLINRVNHERYIWFGGYRKRRPKNDLSNYLRNDAPFGNAVLDAYSEAWALTFFLIETRPAQYAKYLQRVNARSPFQPYEPEERLGDFQESFGNNLDLFESQYLRFIDEVK